MMQFTDLLAQIIGYVVIMGSTAIFALWVLKEALSLVWWLVTRWRH